MSTGISTRTHQENPDKFERLFQLGLTYIQQLSGKIWTDYNTHDPGITILEQVCFMLTDIIYRSDFAVADYLTAENGRIDYPEQGLAHPEAILSALPQQIDQYEQWLLQAIPDLDNVWMRMSEGASHTGLYDIKGQLQRFYRASQPVASQKRHRDKDKTMQTMDAITQAYHRIRGLGEDVKRVHIIAGAEVHLIAIIDIADHIVDLNQMAAMIYDKTHQWFHQRASDDAPYALKEWLLTLPGILNIQSLHFIPFTDSDSKSHVIKTLPEHASLMMPETTADIGITLIQDRYTAHLDVEEIALLLEQFRHQPPTSLRSDHALPSGKYLDLAAYESIQTLFPRNYLLSTKNEGAYQATSRAERHQLRSYLLLFDQLMANFCQDLSGIRALFSTSLATPHSYLVQVLNHHQFTASEQHYPADAATKLRALQNQFDDYPERKGRLLDYLLSLYGEAFPDLLHRQFNPYFSANILEKQLLRYKQRFIRNIVTMTKERGLGNNLTDPDNDGGYQKRISLLLGLLDKKPDWVTYSRAITQYRLNVVTNAHYCHSEIGAKALFTFQHPLLSQLETVPARQDDIGLSPQQNTQIHASIVAFSSQILPKSLLQYGVSHQQYRILRRTQDNQYQLYFDMGNKQTSQWLYIARHRNKKKLIRFCHLLQQWLIQLNQENEGLYVVEDLTLRNSQNCTDLHDYAHRISVVLPGFTARHHNLRFRQQAEALIRANSPAQLLTQIHWLDFYPFCAFETHYLAWRKHKAAALNQWDDAAQAECDRLAAALYGVLKHPHAAEEGLIL